MTRRRPDFLDPTGRLGHSDEFVRLLRRVLDTLSERESGVLLHRFGLLDGRPRTHDEIGRIYGVHRERVRQIESAAMSRLRHPARATVLRDFMDDEFVEISDDVRLRLRGSLDAEPPPLAHCDKHGWSDPGADPIAEPLRCLECPCALAYGQSGRPRRYCSGACRQAAYRRRRSGHAG